MLAMAEGLGMAVVVEGVETTEVAAALRVLGCRSAQGFLWARPVEAAAFADLVLPAREGVPLSS